MTAMARRDMRRALLLALGFATCNFVVPRLPTLTAPRVTRMPARESALPRQSFMAGAKGGNMRRRDVFIFNRVFCERFFCICFFLDDFRL